MAKKVENILEMKDLLGKSLKDLVALRTTLKQDVYENRIKNSLRSLNHTHLIGVARKNIARVQTAMHQKIDLRNAEKMLTKGTKGESIEAKSVTKVTPKAEANTKTTTKKTKAK